jgi:ABC-type microcin C transport system duplicated ATPase subunit YejF
MSRHEEEKLVTDALIEVGLDLTFAARYPHEISGGQAQRAAIARAIIAKPDVLVLDEPVSALDVAIRGQILDLLDALKTRHGLAMLFITHDLGVARSIANDVIVMQNGVIVEEGPASDVLAAPTHPYTQALVAASPSLAR